MCSLQLMFKVSLKYTKKNFKSDTFWFLFSFLQIYVFVTSEKCQQLFSENSAFNLHTFVST